MRVRRYWCDQDSQRLEDFLLQISLYGYPVGSRPSISVACQQALNSISSNNLSVPSITRASLRLLLRRQHHLVHAPITVTLDRYSHLIPSMGRHFADGTDGPFGERLLLPYCCQSPRQRNRGFSFLWDLQEKQRADERTRTAYPCSLRVIHQALLGVAAACKSSIFKQVSLLRVAQCCTVLRSRWYQSGIKRAPV